VWWSIFDGPRYNKAVKLLAASEIIERLREMPAAWLKASEERLETTQDPGVTERVVQQFERVWGADHLSRMFRRLLKVRGVSLYDRHLEHHFTGSVMVVDFRTQRLLLTFHPYYQIWQQLGGHDEGEHIPVAVAAREAWEESGIDDLWVFDLPVRIDPHSAEKCRTVPGQHHNYHYDMCYMAVTLGADFVMSEESVDMRWFSLEELKRLVGAGKAQQRALEMARNSLRLLAALEKLNKLPGGFSQEQGRQP
jgi:8-oxo-dGTP pyrophosphatase MutT (NUDIX family)